MHAAVCGEDVAHHEEPRVAAQPGAHAVHPEKMHHERLRMGDHVGVVLFNQPQEQAHLLLAHRLDEEPVIGREEENAA